MDSNYFVHRSAAERYARGRPYFHPLVVERIAPQIGPLERALDVGCGTGLSSRALSELAGSVVGVDSSVGMLTHAPASPRVRYAAATAETLPFCSGAFGLITVGLAFHWFNRQRFLAEAHRVLAGSGWLVIYNNWFTGRMRENPAFAEWWREEYLARYPSPPRHGHPLSATDAREGGFSFVENTGFENEVSLSSADLVMYLTTQSNVIAAVEEGRETLTEVTDWLARSVQPLFRGRVARFAFGGSLWVLRKHSAAQPADEGDEGPFHAC